MEFLQARSLGELVMGARCPLPRCSLPKLRGGWAAR